jgi:hypothetical protein
LVRFAKAALAPRASSDYRRLPRRIRINAVSPPWVKETLVKLGMDAASALPSAEVAHAYVAAVEGTQQGQILAP